MIKSYSLHTSEADRAQIAVRDIMAQMDDIHLLTHSAGVVVCHYDFIESGAVSALQEALPFPLIGITTFYQATPVSSGLFELTITVLTSDDIRFATACSEPARPQDCPAQKIRDTYKRAYDVYGEKPALILSFPSANRPVSGDAYLRILDDVSGGVPNFGFVAAGEAESGTNINVISSGRTFSDGIAILLLIGDVRVSTYVTQTAEARLLAMTPTVTAAQGAIVQELNGQPAAQYLLKHGVVLDAESRDDISTIPFFFRHPGEDVLIGRALRTFCEDGGLEFLAEIPQGALMRVGTVTPDDLLDESALSVQRAIRENPKASVLLVGSCIGRFITLGLDTTSEMDHALDGIPAAMNYLACYVCGEICPVNRGGLPVNRYHNNSFIVCALE